MNINPRPAAPGQFTEKENPMKKSLMLGAAAAALCLASASAHAMTQCPNMVEGDIVYTVGCIQKAVTISANPLADIVVPTGQWFNGIADVVIAVVPTVSMAILGWALNKYLGIKLDAHYNEYIKGLEVDALQAGRNWLQAKTPDQVVVPTQSELVDAGAKWIIENEEPALVKWFGGAAGVANWLNSKVNVLPPAQAAAIAAASSLPPAAPVVAAK